MRFVMLFSVMLFCAARADAQALTGYNLKIFNQGALLPMSTTPMSVTAFTCGQTPKVTQPNGTNAKRVIIDDPAAPGTADCVYTDNGTGPLVALPFGTQVYVATINAVYPAGTSADSNVSNPFSHPGVVGPAPSGLRIGQ